MLINVPTAEEIKSSAIEAASYCSGIIFIRESLQNQYSTNKGIFWNCIRIFIVITCFFAFIKTVIQTVNGAAPHPQSGETPRPPRRSRC